jgi:hypothetical protein
MSEAMINQNSRRYRMNAVVPVAVLIKTYFPQLSIHIFFNESQNIKKDKMMCDIR